MFPFATHGVHACLMSLKPIHLEHSESHSTEFSNDVLLVLIRNMDMMRQQLQVVIRDKCVLGTCMLDSLFTRIFDSAEMREMMGRIIMKSNEPSQPNATVHEIPISAHAARRERRVQHMVNMAQGIKPKEPVDNHTLRKNLRVGCDNPYSNE